MAARAFAFAGACFSSQVAAPCASRSHNRVRLPPEVAALIVQLQQQVRHQAQQLSERDQALAQRDALLQRKDREIALREAKIEKITWNVIADDTSAITALQNGELDYMVVPISYWGDIKASDKFNCVEKESNEVMLFCINVESKTHGELLRNDNIRLAMMYALDRDGINKLVCDGYGTPTYMYINPNYAAAAPTADSLKNPIPYNLQKAKELLAQEGYPDGIDIGEFNVAAGRNENFGVAVQAQLEAAGIKSTLVVSDYNVAGDRNVAQEYDICIAYDCGNYDFNNFEQQSSSAAIGLTNVLFNGPSGKFNDLSAKFDEWLKEGSSTADEAKRIEIYTEMYNAYYDTHTQVPLINLPSCVAYSKDLNAIAVPTDYRVYDWSWNS